MYSTEPYNIIDTESLDEYISDTYSMQNIISHRRRNFKT